MKKGPWFRKQRNCWCCTVKGKTIILAHGYEKYDEALQKYLIVRQPGYDTLVSVVLAEYLDWLARHRRKSTVELRKYWLDRFAQEFGQRKVSELLPAEVDKWGNGRGVALQSVSSLLDYCRTQKKVPLLIAPGDLHIPKSKSRGKECLPTSQEFDALLAACVGGSIMKPFCDMPDVLQLLDETGARPGELILLHAHHYHPDIHALVIPAEECKTHVVRTIYLTTNAEIIVKKNCLRYPQGHILRNGRAAWTYEDLAALFERLRNKAKVRKEVTLYSFRHSFATRWLLARKSPIMLMHQLGHKTLDMIIRHYAHLLGEHQELLKELRKEAANNDKGTIYLPGMRQA